MCLGGVGITYRPVAPAVCSLSKLLKKKTTERTVVSPMSYGVTSMKNVSQQVSE